MTRAAELKESLAIANRLADIQSAGSYAAYLKHVVIDSRPEPKVFASLAKDWQWQQVSQKLGAVETIAGLRNDYVGPMRFMDIMPRGHDKTGSVGRIVNWLLSYSKLPLSGIVGSGDGEQAGLLLEAMRKEMELNPWLKKRLTFRKTEVEGPGGLLQVKTSDAKTAFGATPDFVICDEWTHWRHENGEKFFGALFSSRIKRPKCLFIILCNAGIKNTWQWDFFQKAKDAPGWVVFDAPGQLLSWMSPEEIAADYAMLPLAEARRVFGNIWIDPAEECNYLTRAEVDRCERPDLHYQFHGDPVLEYALVIDYGPKRDRTALAVMHQEPLTGLLVVDRMDLLQGYQFESGEVPITRLRAWVEECRTAFGPNIRLICDPYQLLELIQYYERHIPTDRFEPRGGKSNYLMAETLRDAIINQRVVWYPGIGGVLVDGKIETLADELVSLVTKNMTYGYRFDHLATKHDDRAAVLGMGCVAILKRPAPSVFKRPKPLMTPPEPFVGGYRDRKSRRSSERSVGGLFGLG